MIDWNYSPAIPTRLTLAADARLTRTDYFNDQIWELNFGSSDPPALCIQTTFGLRARQCRIFPRIICNDQIIIDPAQFFTPIIIHNYFPNYLQLSFDPISSINVAIDYWVPTSQVVAARFKLKNTGKANCSVQLDWVELLLPTESGQRMSADEIGLTTFLNGQTGDLSPVLYLMGGAQISNSPYPALNLTYDLEPHSEQEGRWVHASLSDMNSSYELAKKTINQNWDAEFSRVHRINAECIQIQTGNSDWNLAIKLSQTVAERLLISDTPSCPYPSIINSRSPDQGHSILGDGSDYSHLWNGPTLMDVHYYMNFLSPSASKILQGLIDNYLSTQTQLGEIDWKPGSGGQRSGIEATPMLAELTLQLFNLTNDIEYVRNIFPKLMAFFLSWFTTTHDRDSDLIPEWDQIVQTGYEDHILFSPVHKCTGALDISTVESPDLSAYLYREAICLKKLAKFLNQPDDITLLEKYSSNLKQMVNDSWSDQQVCYLYRDRDSHLSNAGLALGSSEGAGVLEVHQEFTQPVRPTIYLDSTSETCPPVNVFIHGVTPGGVHRVDSITSSRFRWHLGFGFATSEFTFTSIEQIEIRGIQPEDRITVKSADLTTLVQSLLIPLWAGIPAPDQARVLISLTIMDKKKFLCSNGLRLFVDRMLLGDSADGIQGVNLPMINLILSGMIDYGERKKAAEVFTRMMKPAIESLQIDAAFHHTYDCESGKPYGTRNSLSGLIPVGLFLKLLGVKIINQNKVELSGINPFPWPVTVIYKGLTLIRHDKKTFIIFSDGQTMTVNHEPSQVSHIEKLPALNSASI